MSAAPVVDEVAALRAKLAAARAPRDQKQAALEREAEIARLTQEIADEPAIAEMVDKHGAVGDGIAILRTPEGAVVVKRPQQAVWRRFSDTKNTDGPAVYKLVRGCVVYPSLERLEAIIEKRPAALEQLGGLISELAIARDADLAGK